MGLRSQLWFSSCVNAKTGLAKSTTHPLTRAQEEQAPYLARGPVWKGLELEGKRDHMAAQQGPDFDCPPSSVPVKGTDGNTRWPNMSPP